MGTPAFLDPSVDWPGPVARVQASLGPDTDAWLVGGAVRDRLLGRHTQDFDFVIQGEARKAGRRVADQMGGEYYDLDAERDTGRVLLATESGRRVILDFARLGGDIIEDDLRRRDFRVDALAVSLKDPDQIIDPTGGLVDIADRALRACAKDSLVADPIRAWRGVRLSHELGLSLDTDALAQIASAGPLMGRVSAERLRDELYRVLGLEAAPAALRQLLSTGLLAQLLPELEPLGACEQVPPHEFDVLEHSIHVATHLSAWVNTAGSSVPLWSDLEPYTPAVQNHLAEELALGRTRGQTLMLAGLLHDIGKPATRTDSEDGKLRFLGHEAVGAELALRRGVALRLGGRESAVLRRVIAHHMRPGQLAHEPKLTGRAMFRYFQAAGAEGLEIGVLSLADLCGQRQAPPDPTRWQTRLSTVRRLFEAYFDRSQQEVSPEVLLRGDELMREMDLPPGPLVGELLDSLRQAQAEGEVTTRSEALAFLRQQLANRLAD